MTKRIANLYVCPICGNYETVGVTGPKPLCSACSSQHEGEEDIVWMELVRGPEEELYMKIFYGHQKKYPATKGHIRCRRSEVKKGMPSIDIILFSTYQGSYRIPLQ
jgi:hypothetical protein